MKYIILLASSDEDAKKNYIRLVEHRANNSSTEEQPLFTLLEYDSINKLLKQNKESISNILQATDYYNKRNIEIEFIAHGHPHLSDRLLIEPKKKPGEKIDKDMPRVFEEITPEIVANFFKEMTNSKGEYNFGSLTLYCCSSLKFGRELSILMPGMSITCFNEDIKINVNGVPCNGYNKDVIAKSYIFSSGKLLISESEVSDEEKKLEPAKSEQRSNITSDNLHNNESLFIGAFLANSSSNKQVIQTAENSADKSSTDNKVEHNKKLTSKLTQSQNTQRGVIYGHSQTLLDLARQNAINNTPLNNSSPKLVSSPTPSSSNAIDESQIDATNNNSSEPSWPRPN